MAGRRAHATLCRRKNYSLPHPAHCKADHFIPGPRPIVVTSSCIVDHYSEQDRARTICNTLPTVMVEKLYRDTSFKYRARVSWDVFRRSNCKKYRGWGRLLNDTQPFSRRHRNTKNVVWHSIIMLRQPGELIRIVYFYVLIWFVEK